MIILCFVQSQDGVFRTVRRLFGSKAGFDNRA